MKIKLLFFARLKEIFGDSWRWMEVDDGSSIAEVLERLVEESGELSLKEMPLLFAVNENFETSEKKLASHDQLALMTPMSGG